MSIAVARTSRIAQAWSEMYNGNVVNIPASSTATIPMAAGGNWESREASAGVAQTLAPVPTASGSAMVPQVAGFYFIRALVEIQLGTPIGAFPVVISSNLWTGPTKRDGATSTLRAGVTGDTFTQVLTYEDFLSAGQLVYVQVTAGDTPLVVPGDFGTYLTINYVGVGSRLLDGP